MGAGDFFSRNSLLPEGQRAKLLRSSSAPPDRSSRPTTGRSDDALEPLISEPGGHRDSDPEVFERPTVVPQLPAEEHARALMEKLKSAESAAAVGSDLVPSPPPLARKDISLSFSALELGLDEAASALGLVDLQAEADTQSEPPPEPGHSAEAPTARPAASDANARGQPANVSDLYQFGDFTGALAEAERMLKRDPDDEVARRYRARCHDVLTKMWTARLGSLDRPVKMLIGADQLRWLSVDHRAGFVLSLIDGSATLDQILDVAGMPRLEALRILSELSERGVIEVTR